MIRKPISKTERIAWTVLAFGMLFVSYCYLSYQQHKFNPKDSTIPNMSQLGEGVIRVLYDNNKNLPWNIAEKNVTKSARLKDVGTPEALAKSKEILSYQFFRTWLYEDTTATIGRHFGGMMIATIVSIILGMSMGCWSRAEAFLSPPVTVFGTLTPTAMMAIYFVLFGTEYKMFVAAIALGVIPTFAKSVHQAAAKDVKMNSIYKAYTLGASNLEIVYHVVFKRIMPKIIEAVRSGIGPALVFLIAAELLVADVGFGYRIRIQSRLLNMNVVYLYLALMALTFYLVNLGLLKLRQRLYPWYGE